MWEAFIIVETAVFLVSSKTVPAQLDGWLHVQFESRAHRYLLRPSRKTALELQNKKRGI